MAIWEGLRTPPKCRFLKYPALKGRVSAGGRMTALYTEKELLRALLKKKRGALSAERRKKAYADLNRTLLPLLKPYKAILSFHSLPEEIDLTFINQMLAVEGKLHLPKVGSPLQIFHIKNPSQELFPSKWGLFEPDSSQSLLVDIKKIDCILVPGLGFDKDHYRIGYGKGHYDALLALCVQQSHHPATVGVGFTEQYYNELPRESHDMPLDELKLF